MIRSPKIEKGSPMHRLTTLSVTALLLGSTGVIADPIVTGNTISWPDDGWYQVQQLTNNDYLEVCAGGQQCTVPDGNYVVINHTTGQRFERVSVGESWSDSGVVIDGNTISWPDNGWYQVQQITEAGYVNLCEGTLLCSVPDGKFVVINHSTGERIDNIVVGSGSAVPVPTELPIVRAETWPDILQNVVKLINADRALDRHKTALGVAKAINTAAISETFDGGPAGPLAMIGLSPLPLADPANNTVLDYSCDAGGTIAVTITPNVPVYYSESKDCAIAGNIFNGIFDHDGVGLEGFRTNFTDIKVLQPDNTRYEISGTHRQTYGRLANTRSTQWSETSVLEQSGDVTYVIDDFNMISNSAHGENTDSGIGPDIVYADGTVETSVQEYRHNASVTGSFSITAPWTNAQVMQVSTDLKLGGNYLFTELELDGPAPYQTATGAEVWTPETLNEQVSQWSSGSVNLVAADGSRLTLRPVADDSTRALVEINGNGEQIPVLWSEGFQVSCFGGQNFSNCSTGDSDTISPPVQIPPQIAGPVSDPELGMAQNLRAVVYNDAEAEIFWDEPTPDSNVVAYRITRNGEILIAETNTFSFYDSSLEPSRSYTYEVTPLGSDNTEGLATSAMITTPPKAREISSTNVLDLFTYLVSVSSTDEITELLTVPPVEAGGNTTTQSGTNGPETIYQCTVSGRTVFRETITSLPFSSLTYEDCQSSEFHTFRSVSGVVASRRSLSKAAFNTGLGTTQIWTDIDIVRNDQSSVNYSGEIYSFNGENQDANSWSIQYEAPSLNGETLLDVETMVTSGTGDEAIRRRFTRTWSTDLSVQSPTTNNRKIVVQTVQPFVSYNTIGCYVSGRLVATAVDGTRLEVNAYTGSLSTFFLDAIVDGEIFRQELLWRDHVQSNDVLSSNCG